MWNKVIYSIVIMLLYIPMAFLGVNTFFPEYGSDSYPYIPCPNEQPCAVNDTECAGKSNECYQKQDQENRHWQEEKRAYESWKYIALMVFNVLILLIVLFATFSESVMFGLFFGSVVTSFISTIRYLNSRSKIGFFLMVLMFLLTIYFVNKKKQSIIDKKF